jgi:hypothetical protein
VRTPAEVLALLLMMLTACAQEATAPQGAAAISRVVPVATPDVWCPAMAADTLPARDRCHPTVHVPPHAIRDSTGRTMRGSLWLTGDSTRSASDTIR